MLTTISKANELKCTLERVCYFHFVIIYTFTPFTLCKKMVKLLAVTAIASSQSDYCHQISMKQAAECGS